MGQREELSSMFDFDCWANQKWMQPARSLAQEHVLLHVVEAQIIWLARIQGTPTWQPSLEEFGLHLDKSTRNWKRFLMGADLGQLVTYANSRGEQYTNSVTEIVRHVINHGSYHRGQLRGIAGERGIEFPETDYIAFAREKTSSFGYAVATVS
jgi:uncharacterized damage-inducible protein DinB